MQEIKTQSSKIFKEFIILHKRAILLATGIALILLVAFLFSFSFPKKQVGDFSQEKWQTYTSDSLGFSVSLPTGWSVKEEAAESGPDILIVKNNGSAFVRIRGFLDPYLDSEEALKASLDEYHKELALQEGVSLSSFQTGGVKENIAEFSVGGQFLVRNTSFRFYETGQISMSGQALVLRAASLPQDFDESIPIMKEIIDNFVIL